MRFTELAIPGAFLVDLERKGDDRGFFARQYCQEEFRAEGLSFDLAQANTSFSAEARTLRGMHYQVGEAAETKLVRCVRGEIWDCVLDLRKGSSTFGAWHGELLTSENRRMMLVPKGCAHGFLSISENSEILYLVDALYSPKMESGVRWDDPFFAIDWPAKPKVISKRDTSHALYSQANEREEINGVWFARGK